jgi:hypothetical protein
MITETTDEVYSVLISFKYKVNQVELKVDDVFVKHYNSSGDPYRPKLPEAFANSLLNTLKEILKYEGEQQPLSSLIQRQFNDAYNLVLAIKQVLLREQTIYFASRE